MDEKEKQPEPKQIQVIKTERQLLCSRFSPDGTHLVAGGMDAKVHRWTEFEVELEDNDESKDKKGDKEAVENKIEWKPLKSLEGHRAWVGALGFHPTEKKVFTGDSWGQLRCSDYEGENPKLHWAVDKAHDGWLRQLDVDEQHVVTAGRDRVVRLWDHSGKRIAEWEGSEEVYALAIHPSGKRVVFGDAKGIARVWDFGSKEISLEFPLTEFFKLSRLQDVCGLTRFIFIEEGRSLLAVGCAPTDGGTMQGIPTVDLIDFASGESRDRIQFGVENDAFITDAAWHPDGYVLCATSGVTARGSTVFVRPDDEKPFYTNTKIVNIHSLALHPDNKRFLVTGTNRTSNGNGRRLNKEGDYEGNNSPIHFFELPSEA